jgi:putative glycosyltransferase (TIGR04348 family)
VSRRPWTIVIVTPAPRGSSLGNRVTAERWARILRSLGHRVVIRQDWQGEPCDLLVALHACRSGSAALRFAGEHPERPLVVGLAGTDIYGGLDRSDVTLRVLASATRLVALQEFAVEQIPAPLRAKMHVIVQSAEPPRHRIARRRDAFEIAVVGHLRAVKDPFRAALAARKLPPRSRVRILHAGSALTPGMEARTRAEQARNPRYRWLGELTHRRALSLVARCRAVVVSSWSEGGANIVSEALAGGTPLLASRVPGNVGLLGPGYPAYFEAGSTDELAALILRYESDVAFRENVTSECKRLARSVRPARERAAWRRLLAELAATGAEPRR